ncbi:MAG: restriction endonuclease, partial [Candidatus Binatia bacterium]
MKEDELRTDVLIPLFRAMGFQDVHHHHGGSGERGKDIIMWRPEGLRERVNYAVVAKADKISGKTSGNSSIGEVRFQIEQCFNEPYADPRTTKEEKIERCWVVSSKDIKKEAKEAIKGNLEKSNLDKITDFIDGDQLWELIERNRTRGVQATVLRAEEQLGAGARGLGFCRWLPSKPQLSSPT